MINQELLSNAKITVKRLILQYNEYLALQNVINKKESEKLTVISKINKYTKKNISQIMQDQTKYEELTYLNKEIDLLNLDLQQISDEMTFPNPVVWMMYKFKAYMNKSNEISTLRQFRIHCSPDGYICTERYRFLNKYLISNYSKDLNDILQFPEESELKKLYQSKLIIDLFNDLEFINTWKENEYLKTNGKVNKWKTVVKNI